MGLGQFNPFKPGSIYERAGQSVSKVTQKIGGVLATIDPGPAIGKAGAQLDKAVGSVIPGGWITVGAIALVVAAPYLAPQLSAYSASAAASEAALAAGATAAEAAAAGQAAAASSLAGAVGTAGTGLTTGAVNAALTEGMALNSALTAAGKGALIGGGLSGGMAAIQGGDPLKAALKGAFYGGLTAGIGSGLNSALSSADLLPAGLNSSVARALTSAGTTALRGGDLSEVLQNSALSTGLGELAKGANQYVNPAITSAGTGAIGSAIKGGDPLQGAITGAAGSLLNQGVNAGKDLYGRLTAPSNEAINPATGQPWSETGSGLTGSGAGISLNANMDATSLDLNSKYLTEASGTISSKLAELMPTIEEQRAALLDRADTVKSNYDAVNVAQNAVKNAIDGEYNPKYENVVALQDKAQYLYDKITNAQTVYNTNKTSYESSSGIDTSAFTAANAAAAELNELIPQYNTTIQDFTTANTELTDVFESYIQPLIDAFETAKTTLDDNVSDFATAETNFDGIVDTASSYLTGLNDISEGKLPTDYKAATLAMSAPTAEGFTNEELADYQKAIEEGAQAAAAAAGTGTQTASNNGIGYVPSDVSYVGDKIQITSPEGDFTDAQPIPFPEEPVPEEPVPQEDLSQKVLESFDYGLDMILNHMADDRWVVVDANTGTALGEVNAPVEPTPVEPTPVEPTPVEPTPVEPTPVEPTPVEPTPVEPTPVEPTPVEPTPVEPTPVEPTPVAPTPVGSVTNPDGSVTTYYDDGTTKVTVPSDTTGGVTDTTGGVTDTTGGVTDTTGGGTTGGLDTIGGATGGSGAGFGDDGFDLGGIGIGDTNTGGGSGTGFGDDGFDLGGIGIGDDIELPEEPTPPPPTTEEPTTPPPSGGGTSTGSGGTSTGGGGGGGGGTSTGSGGTSTGSGGGTTPRPTTSSSSGLSNLAANTSALSAFLTPIFITGGPKIKQKNPLEAFNSQVPEPEVDTPPVAQAPFDPYANTGFLSPINRATGGSVFQNTMPNQEFASMNAGLDQPQVPKIIKQRNPLAIFGKAEGGSIQEHNPQFYSEGGLSVEHRYVKGEGDGTSDSVPAMLANGEFVIPADIVSSLGNGSNDSGAKILDEFLKTIRDHKHKSNAKKLPPDSKGPLSYLQQAKKKVKV